jgi:hypothetical protein
MPIGALLADLAVMACSGVRISLQLVHHFWARGSR